MSLQDKLNENRNMSELFQETKELNELMKSYIRVHMNEEMAKEVTIHNQLNQIQEKSDKVMSNMKSILKTKGTKLEEKEQIKQEQEHERNMSRNEETQRTDEKLYQSSHERGNGERSHDTQSIESDSRKIGQSHEQHAINFEHARQDVRRKRREFASDF